MICSLEEHCGLDVQLDEYCLLTPFFVLVLCFLDPMLLLAAKSSTSRVLGNGEKFCFSQLFPFRRMFGLHTRIWDPSQMHLDLWGVQSCPKKC